MQKVLQFSHDTEKPETPSMDLPFQQIPDKPRDRERVVLVMVDDDEDDCILVNEALKLACNGCTFLCVGDGDEMLDYLNRRGRYKDLASCPVPDIILLDLNMPKMGGREVLENLKTDPRFRAIPVIILTTSRELDDVKACYDLGANSYITKQSSFEEVVSCIKTLVEYWTEVATLPHKKAHAQDPGEPSKLS
ncbi:MAG: response regulator [Syntrophobacteraceae bacterium]|jgi:CheY-like chemotaxis protein